MRLLPKDPPPGPADPTFWQSPLRGPWLTSILGSLLLIGVTIVATTGFLSHAAYNPELGTNALIPLDRDLPLISGFDWPTSPSWLYAFTQGTHTVIGVVTVPLLLAKLWSVIPKLFSWPPVGSPAKGLERLTILLLVGSAFFEFATGIVNFQLYYPFHFGFVQAHYYGAWVFVTSIVLHVGIKLPTIRTAYRERGVLKPLMDDVAHTEVEPRGQGDDALPTPIPEAASISRRGLLGLVGAASGGLFVLTAGQSIGGPFRGLALLAPRGTGISFPVNKTASLARVTPQMAGAAWRLQVKGTRTVTFDRAALLRMQQHTVDLPIACVEGWSTTQSWTGVRLRDLAAMAGADGDQGFHAESLQAAGAFRQTTLSHDQTMHPDALLALKVNGEDLALDHGFPARLMVPAMPGVHQIKWIKSLELQ